MDRSAQITLIKEAKTQDVNGVWTITTTSRTVFCQVDSVTRSEFYEGGRNGLKPEYRFTMFFGDYEGERTVEFNGKYYGIYRTYLGRTDTIELYAERKGGTNVAPDPEPEVVSSGENNS